MADRMLPDAMRLLSCLLLLGALVLLCGDPAWAAQPAPTPTPQGVSERSMTGPIIGVILVVLSSLLAVFGSLAISRHMKRIAGIRDDER